MSGLPTCLGVRFCYSNTIRCRRVTAHWKCYDNCCRECSWRPNNDLIWWVVEYLCQYLSHMFNIILKLIAYSVMHSNKQNRRWNEFWQFCGAKKTFAGKQNTKAAPWLVILLCGKEVHLCMAACLFLFWVLVLDTGRDRLPRHKRPHDIRGVYILPHTPHSFFLVMLLK